MQEIPGIGPTRKRALLRHFGTVKAIERASLPDLAQVPGINAETARKIYEFFHEQARALSRTGSEGQSEMTGMIIPKQEDVTPKVLDAYKNIDDPRLREIVASLVKHLHAFAREVHLTEEEFQKARQLIARIGQMTNATHNEVVLMSGSLGFSALVCLLNNGNNGQTETTANLLGPFWRMNSPRTENGGSIVRSPTPGPAIFVNCWVKDQNGKPIEGAEVDVWHSSPEGFYEQQDPEAGRHEPARQVHDRQGRPFLVPQHQAGRLSDPDRRPGRRSAARRQAAQFPARRTCTS